MSFTITRLVFRMIKKERDFSFIDKIGLLTNTFISTIPNTELQRNGEYGALVILNQVYNFESQITKSEYNFAVNINKNIEDEECAKYFEQIFDVSEKVIKTIKKVTESKHDLKSIICIIEGKFSSDKDSNYDALITSLAKNDFIEEDSEIKQTTFAWQKQSHEYYLNLFKDIETNDNKIAFAIQDFQKDDMSFSNIKAVFDFCFRELNDNIITKING